MEKRFIKKNNTHFWVVALCLMHFSNLFGQAIEAEDQEAAQLFFQFKKTECSNHLKQAQLGDLVINYPEKSEPELQEMVNRIFTSNGDFFMTQQQAPVIIICGNELGFSTLYYKSQYPNASVTVFEDDEETFSALKRNIFSNSLQNVVTHKSSLGKEQKTISTPYTKQDPFFKALCEEAKRDLVIYETKTIEKLSDHINQPVDCLKLDMPGKELEIIEELAQSSKLSLIKKMIVTFHHNVDPANSLAQFLSILEKNQFDYALEKSSHISFFDRGSSDVAKKEQSFYIYATKKE